MVDLRLGDCLEIMRAMPDDSISAVVTDPPYGIGVTAMTLGNGRNRIYRGEAEWDVVPDKIYFDEMLRVSRTAIIWGGNYFSAHLPATRGWLVWDKRTGANSFADCELAWTNIDTVTKMFTVPWVGGGAKDTRERLHPTQKPITLMVWCMELAGVGSVLDPFMGSGTTGVACAQTGRDFIGAEIDPVYFEIAKGRITEAESQMLLPI